MLSLSHYYNIELPESIWDFKYLRYLDVSFTKIERLPESTCMLLNLQMLNLSGSKFLVKLPKNMRNLINLRHLYISGTSIKNLPIHMGWLECLQTLTKFVVGKDIGFRIEELGKLSNIRGVIGISNLQNVIYSTNALEANLKDKEHLKELTLEWDAHYIAIILSKSIAKFALEYFSYKREPHKRNGHQQIYILLKAEA